MKINIKKQIVAVGIFTINFLILNNSFADYNEAMFLRSLIEFKPGMKQVKSNEHKIESTVTKKLRTTRGFDQGGSEFCWVFATLNVLESNYLEQNPEVEPAQVELSRWFFVEATNSYYQRGTMMDAINFYALQIGLVLDRDYTKGIPESTNFLGKNISPQELRTLMINDQTFTSYAFSDSRKGWYMHADPDALEGTLSYYVKREEIDDIIKKSLNKGKAVAYLVGGHILTIYGADFHSSGNASKYYVKDSYANYFYEASSDAIHTYAIEITTVDNLVDIPNEQIGK